MRKINAAKSKVKIRDIAEQSGVSAATVSLALNNRPGVSRETSARVIRTAEALGYQVKPLHAEAQASKLKTLGMIVKSQPGDLPHSNPFYSKIIFGIEDACSKLGINLLFATLLVDENNRAIAAPPVLYSDAVDGLLMVGAFVDETVLSISGRHTPPIVLVDAYSNTESFDMVISDNFRAAYQAVSYLIQKGHRHIALAGGNENAYPSLRDRRNGYLRALKDNDISDAYYAEFNINKARTDTVSPESYAETLELLKANPQITAVFGINDSVAIAAMHAARELGRSVPEDLSVIGYDDTYLALHVSPQLTTMHVDTIAMGRAAVQMLAFRLENPEVSRMTLTVHPFLIERDSVCPLPS